MRITHSEASDLIARLKAARQDGRMMDVIMPNGKRLGDCTKEDLDELGEVHLDLAESMDDDS